MSNDFKLCPKNKKNGLSVKLLSHSCVKIGGKKEQNLKVILTPRRDPFSMPCPYLDQLNAMIRIQLNYHGCSSDRLTQTWRLLLRLPSG